MLTYEFRLDDVLTDADGVEFLSPNGAYGLRITGTGEIVVAAGTDWDNVGTGLYEFDLAPLELDEETTYDYWVAATYDGETIYLQRSITGSGETVGTKTIRFVAVAGGAPVALDEVPTLTNPTDSYGVVRTDTGAVVVAKDTPLGAIGLLWSASWGEPAEGLTYRYYVRAELGGKVYYLPRTTSYMHSAALVVGRYTDSVRIEQQFGAENLHKFLGIDESDEAVDYALRLYEFIDAAEAHLDDLLRPVFDVPLTIDPVPAPVARAATLLAGVRAYEARGAIDINAETGQVQHRYTFQKKEAERIVAMLLKGSLRLEGDQRTRHPQVVGG